MIFQMKSTQQQFALVTLGDRIRDLRLMRSLSQEELAAMAGVHRTYIGMVERGEKNVTILTLSKLCKALRLSISDLTRGLEGGQ
jgi:transcriptional regulator with XRE-family HTH domain